MSEDLELRGMALQAMMEVEALKAKLASLEASQARWVKCSERLPEKMGYYITSGWVIRWFQPDFIEWKGVVAWLENVPEYVP